MKKPHAASGIEVRFSRRTGWDPRANPLAGMLAGMRRRGAPVIDLTESNPTRCGFRALEPGLLAPLADPRNLRYDPDPRGLLEAREAVSRYYGERGLRVDPADIFLTAGTSEAYAHLFRLLADAGDKAAVPCPGYPLFEYLADLSDLVLVRYRLAYRKGWVIDEAAFAEAMREAPRLILLVNPNNPTGNFVCAAEREFLNRAACDTGAAIIADEVFCDFGADGIPFSGAGFCAGGSALTFTLGGISKLLGLPQMKLAWIVLGGPAEIRRRAAARLETIADTFLSVGTPVQRALSAWLQAAGPVVAEIRERLSRNEELLKSSLNDNRSAAVLRRDGGWYAVIRLAGEADEEAAALALLEKAGVLVHPGYFYDFDAERCLVVSLLGEPRTFEEGVGRLRDALGQ